MKSTTNKRRGGEYNIYTANKRKVKWKVIIRRIFWKI